jgi:diacylglycerol kinase family enzyme
MERVLLIVNPQAGAVSPRTSEAIVKILSADTKLDVADTNARDHATELAADAVDRGFDAVIALGGDGTINEAAQAVVGTDVALGFLPGGTTNVMVRSLGLPLDPVEATVLLASRLRSSTKRRINVGALDERYFLFSAGMGLDAEVVKRVEADPEAKRKRGHWFFVSTALKAGATQYRGADPAITLEVEGAEPEKVLLVVCCNARPFTYFKRVPVDVCPQASLDGKLDIFGLTKCRAATIPRIAWALLVSHSQPGWRNARYHHDIGRAALTADMPLPVQVDGDYIGDHESAEFVVRPHALQVVS